jgi:hypothetical protein
MTAAGADLARTAETRPVPRAMISAAGLFRFYARLAPALHTSPAVSVKIL